MARQSLAGPVNYDTGRSRIRRIDTMKKAHLVSLLAVSQVLLTACVSVPAQGAEALGADSSIQAMQWRSIGPFNGGRGTS